MQPFAGPAASAFEAKGLNFHSDFEFKRFMSHLVSCRNIIEQGPKQKHALIFLIDPPFSLQALRKADPAAFKRLWHVPARHVHAQRPHSLALVLEMLCSLGFALLLPVMLYFHTSWVSGLGRSPIAALAMCGCRAMQILTSVCYALLLSGKQQRYLLILLHSSLMSSAFSKRLTTCMIFLTRIDELNCVQVELAGILTTMLLHLWAWTNSTSISGRTLGLWWEEPGSQRAAPVHLVSLACIADYIYTASTLGIGGFVSLCSRILTGQSIGERWAGVYMIHESWRPIEEA